jgi:hypothetical protein
MLGDRDREAARLYMQVLDQALISLGRRPVSDNPDFRVTEPLVLDVPTTVLEKPGVAPLRFMFWPDNLDVWVGPFSEVVVVQSSDAGKKNDPLRMIAALLQSSVTCRRKRWWMEITLQRPGAEPWHRLKVSGFDRQAAEALEPIYSPYVE